MVEIAAPRDQVWSFLTDPALVSTCAPDLQQLEVIEPRDVRCETDVGEREILAGKPRAPLQRRIDVG